jgi:hypothetical protein
MSTSINKTKVVMNHIDGLITQMISKGDSTNQIIQNLEAKIQKFDSALKDVSKTEIRYKYLHTHNLVCKKRISDMFYIETLVYNYSEYQEYSLSKLFNLIKFRDKIIFKEFIVEVPE